MMGFGLHDDSRQGGPSIERYERGEVTYRDPDPSPTGKVLAAALRSLSRPGETTPATPKSGPAPPAIHQQHCKGRPQQGDTTLNTESWVRHRLCWEEYNGRPLTWVGYAATQERLLEQEVFSACGLSWAAWGMAAAWPDPVNRQPWYEHCSVPSEGSILP